MKHICIEGRRDYTKSTSFLHDDNTYNSVSYRKNNQVRIERGDIFLIFNIIPLSSESVLIITMIPTKNLLKKQQSNKITKVNMKIYLYDYV